VQPLSHRLFEGLSNRAMENPCPRAAAIASRRPASVGPQNVPVCRSDTMTAQCDVLNFPDDSLSAPLNLRRSTGPALVQPDIEYYAKGSKTLLFHKTIPFIEILVVRGVITPPLAIRTSWRLPYG